MSLDVYLYGEPREDTHLCTHCFESHTTTMVDNLYNDNITHNLGKMAREAGIYDALWRPEEIGIEKAENLIPLLKEGLWRLESDPDHFEQFNSSNGWGLYKHFVPFVRNYLTACQTYPEATVRASR